MKSITKVLLIAIFSGALHSFSYGQDNGYVYFLRSTGLSGAATGYTVFIDGEYVGRVFNNTFWMQEIGPGHHKFSVQWMGEKYKDEAEKEAISITVAADMTYYILLKQSPVNLKCIGITKQKADKKMRHLDDNDDILNRKR